MISIRQLFVGIPLIMGLGTISAHVAANDLTLHRSILASASASPGPGEGSESVPDGRSGYLVMDALTGEVLAARNQDDLFIPASLSKIPTTVVALAAYGAERRFETRLLADGAVVNGVLEGDLHLVGGGDPSLQTQDLWKLANRLAGSGIRRVDGRFTYYSATVPETTRIDRAQPAGLHYNPGVGGLNIDYNMRRIHGRRMPISRPGRLAARMLGKMASMRGVSLPDPVRSDAEPFGMEIATHRSAPVSMLLKRMLDKSTNLTAEVLGAVSANTFGLRPQTLGAAAKMTTQWIKAQAGPIDGRGWNGFRLVNHSGLSTRSRATPRQMAEILRLGYQRFGEAFVNLHRDDSPNGGNTFSIHAKIGSMRFVRGYGGFLQVGGRTLIFTIMSNDDHRRAAADAGQTHLGGRHWMHEARKLERDLLSSWIEAVWHRTAGL